jgi:hypothetical protein
VRLQQQGAILLFLLSFPFFLSSFLLLLSSSLPFSLLFLVLGVGEMGMRE